jgi:hypothetical protein
VALAGRCSDGAQYQTQIFIPQAFTYLMMKLFAFDDRKDDQSKDEGRHHAMDVYRTVAMLTEEEYEETLQLSHSFQHDPRTLRAREIIASNFNSLTSLGMLRLREHQLFQADMPLEQFMSELNALFVAADHR